MRMLFLLVSLVFVFPAFAESQQMQTPLKIELQKVIDACWAISQKDRDSGVTSEMIKGAWATEDCFETKSIELAKELFSDPNDLKKEFLDPLHKARKAYAELIRNMNEGHDYCQLSCGTIQTMIHAAQMAKFKQNIFEKMFRKHWTYVLQK